MLSRLLRIIMVLAVSIGLYHPAAIKAVPRQASDTVSIYGRGWGHGIGMCQEGARGMAELGRSYDDIIRHYYSGVSKSSATTGQLKVRLLVTADPVKLQPSGSFTVYASGSEVARANEGQTWTVTPSNGRFTITGGGNIYANLEPPLSIVPSGTKVVRVLNLRFTRYRGRIILDIDSTGSTAVINQVEIENYLYGVVPSEMPSSWLPEALKAQAIAARCYAHRNSGRHNIKGWGGRTIAADVCSGPHCQVYKGFNMESAKVRAAVDATKQVVYRSKPGGPVISAFFHACCGGHTEDVENVWAANPVTYLKGVEDPYCYSARTFRWKRTASFGQLRSILSRDRRTALAGFNDFSGITRGSSVSDTGSDRIISMNLIGSSAFKKISGTTFKSVLNDWAPRLYPALFPGTGPQTVNDTLIYVFTPPVINSFYSRAPSFSPNGDGRLDKMAGSLAKSAKPARVAVGVYSGSTNVRSILDATVGKTMSFSWDGRNARGVMAPDGRYKMKMAATGSGGSRAVRSFYIRKDTVAPWTADLRVSTTSFVRGAAGCRLAFSVGDTPPLPVFVKVVARSAASGLSVRSWRWQSTSPGAKSLYWDGRSAGGSLAPKGRYGLEVFVRDDAGNQVNDKRISVWLR